jgi:2,4-dienoyl-CoA reductase-like NADH-dependent reductase (Old Yellow Enzyme family)
MSYRRVAQLRNADQFRAHLADIGADISFDDALEAGTGSPLASPYEIHGKTLGNRFCVLPMEGWDGEIDGHPTELVRRRWMHFGLSGAKLIWGCEAVAVRHDGRANHRQLVLNAKTAGSIAALRDLLVAAHHEHFGADDDLMIGLQLTHSGRFCRPNTLALEPRILYHHPLLDKKYGLPENYPVMTDGEIDGLIGDFVVAAGRAYRAGFDFVDIKHCHGYLGHEFLTAIDRPGRYGGSFENRTRFLREVVGGIRRDVPGLHVGVRLSAFDWIPFVRDDEGIGMPDAWPQERYPYAFGGDGNGTSIDLTEPHAFLALLEDLDIRMVCLTGGSPYYTPHLQRPALFPPSDGYLPPEDPLLGVARQIDVTARLKAAHPTLMFVGSGYSYLQDWLPNVAQHVVRTGKADFVGLGRMTLAYPRMPADILAGRPLERKRICRTFSDCTTAPRKGMVSGCYPLDEFYKQREEARQLTELKKKDHAAAN